MTRARLPRRPGQASHDGFTLIELVAVMAIFALVSVMAMQALTGVLLQRDVLTRIDSETAALSRTLALLRRDLESSVQLTFRPVSGREEPAWQHRADSGELAISIAGNPVLPGERGAGLARVIWRLDRAEGVLTRRVWPVLHPAGDDVAGPERAMLAGVEGFAVAAFGDTDDAPDVTVLPPGFEVTLTTRRHGALRLVVAR